MKYVLLAIMTLVVTVGPMMVAVKFATPQIAWLIGFYSGAAVLILDAEWKRGLE